MRPISRRVFLASAAALSPLASRAAPSRDLRFAHLHTGERLAVEYFGGGRYQPDALAAVDHLLRDFRTGEVGRIETALLDLLHELSALVGSARPFEVISGFRSMATNEALRARSSGVASGSLHLHGRAIDIRLADVALPQLRDAALALGRGGVGYYAASRFVHVDTGRVRVW